MSMADSKAIFGAEITSGWRIGFNPYGEGLVLLVDRGINCENHTQIVSIHTTNTPSTEDVRDAVEKYKPVLIPAIEKFCDFVKSFSYAESHRLELQDLNADARESHARIFYNTILKIISNEAVKLMNTKLDALHGPAFNKARGL